MNPAWYIFAFLFSAAVTGLLRIYARKILSLDIPNERSSHTVPTPRGGGLAVVLTFMLGGLCMVLARIVPLSLFYMIMLPGLVIVLIGLADDIRGVSPFLRLFFHAAGVVLFLYCVVATAAFSWAWKGGIPVALLYLFAALGLVWCINLNNFMDGIDGIASVEAISVAGGAAVILLINNGEPACYKLLFLLAAAVAGFLIWNWPPAKIFMGDACSGFLGLTIGLFAILTSFSGGINLVSWLILYGVFVVDATWTLLRRVVRGEKFYLAHRSHAYQRIALLLGSHKKVTLGVLVVNITWLFPLAIVSSKYPDFVMYCLAAAYLPLLLIDVWVGAGTQVDGP